MTSKPVANNSFLKFFFYLTLALAVFFGCDQIKDRFYIFDPQVLQQVSQKNIALYSNDTKLMMHKIAEDLNEMYPGHIQLKEEWVFNNAGGAMGSMWILHGSLTEYVIFFGTPIGTEGHSGRYFADDYFIMLAGEQWAHNPGQLTREVYKVGEMHHLPRGKAQQYKIHEYGFALEYAQGWIPLMLPFGFLDTLFSTWDFETMYNALRLYGVAIVGELLKGKI